MRKSVLWGIKTKFEEIRVCHRSVAVMSPTVGLGRWSPWIDWVSIIEKLPNCELSNLRLISKLQALFPLFPAGPRVVKGPMFVPRGCSHHSGPTIQDVTQHDPTYLSQKNQNTSPVAGHDTLTQGTIHPLSNVAPVCPISTWLSIPRAVNLINGACLA